jgi:hypothetical protein
MPAAHYLLPLLALALIGCNGGADKPRTKAAATGPVIRDGSLMVPGMPQVTGLPAVAAPGPLAVKWSMWWGENGRRWALYVNGSQAGVGELKAASPNQQDGLVELKLDAPGRYEIKVALCNDHGCSESEPALLEVSAG